MKVRVCLAIFSTFCMFCAYSRPRYQVRVYRTIGPLVVIINILALIKIKQHKQIDNLRNIHSTNFLTMFQ